MKKIIFLVCFTQFVISCTETNKSFQQRDTPYVSVSIKLDEISSEVLYQDSLVKNVFYIIPQATENSLISQYDKILVCGDTLFILEKSSIQHKIFAFSSKGRFLFSIDGNGRGPYEYQEINDFYVNLKDKYIGILSASKILKYDFNGNVLGLIDLSNYYVDRIAYSNDFLCANTRPVDNYNKICYSFALFSSDGDLQYMDCPETRRMLTFSYRKENYLSCNSSYVYFNPLNSDTIYEVHPKYLSPKYILNFGNYKTPSEIVNKYVTANDPNGLINSDYNHMGISDFCMTEDYVIFKYLIGKSVKMAIYSNNSNKIIYCDRFWKCDSYLNTLIGVKKYDNKRFYSITSISDALRIKQNEEILGILDDQSKFDKNRLERYNAIKDLTVNDNDVITIFELQDF